MAQLAKAKECAITEEMRIVAGKENVSPEFIKDGIKDGNIIIPANINHRNLVPIGIGRGITTKINANIGASRVYSDLNAELEKIRACMKYGADTAMDLSTGGNLDNIRKAILEEATIPIGTVPIYQAVEEDNSIEEWTIETYLDVIEKQAKQGVDYFTVHAGTLKGMIPLTRKRTTGVVSRGGSILVSWMVKNCKENPLFTNFSQILDIMAEYDVTMSLGDGLRPGCIADATDEAQIAELKVLGDLTLRCWEKDVQVMIEGPGHIPLHQIKLNVDLQKKYCHGAPFYVLGPLITDISPGYDHISSAIGAAVAGQHGADLLCYVTAAEHLGLPTPEQVREGIIAYKIAAHGADLAKGLAWAQERDDRLSRARFTFDWETQFALSLDPERAKEIRSDLGLKADFCSMCGPNFCSMKNFSKTFELKTHNFDYGKKKVLKVIQ